MVDFDVEFDEQCLLCLYDNDRIYYTIVQREPELRYTGVSVIKRILDDKHKFIGDFYATQSYFSIVYIDDDNIKVNKDFSGADRNELSLKELDEYLTEDLFGYIYVYDVARDCIIIKEPNEELYTLDFHNREDVEQFINEVTNYK